MSSTTKSGKKPSTPVDNKAEKEAFRQLPPEQRKGRLEKLFLDGYDALISRMTARYGDLAADATHAVYEKIRTRAIDLSAVEDPHAYLYKMVRNEVRAMVQTATWAGRVMSDPELMSLRLERDSFDAAEDRTVEAADSLVTALNSLTPFQKQVLFLHVRFGMPAHQIASALKISKDRVERALKNARARIKDALTHSPQG